jgi:hypothetical protein
MVDRPRWSCLWGVVRRSLRYRNKPRPDAPADQPIDLAYLRYIWRYPVHTDTLVRGLIDTHGPRIPVIRLEHRRDIKTLLSVLRDAPAG